MKKIDLGQMIQILANVGVLAGIIVVAFEIRQNTQVSIAESIQAMGEAGIQIAFAWADEAVLYNRLVDDGAVPTDFTPEENSKIRLMYFASLRGTESRYLQIELGLIPGADSWFGSGAEIYRAPYLVASWPVVRRNVAPDFASYLEAVYGLPSAE